MEGQSPGTPIAKATKQMLARLRILKAALESVASALMSEAVWLDFRKWLGSVFAYWIGRIGCAGVAAFQLFYGLWKKEWPPVVTWMLLSGCFVAAAFLSWRDEYVKTRSINRRATLYKIRDLIVDTQNALPDAKYDSFGALLKYSEELRSEEDVVWVCNQLKTGNHDHPFGRLELTCDNALSGQWLTFLQEARASNRNIKIVRSAVSFAGSHWSGREFYLKGRERYAESERSDPGLVVDGRRISLLTPLEIQEADSPEKTREAVTVKLSQYLSAGNSFLTKCRGPLPVDDATVMTWANDAGYLIRLAAGEVWQVKFSDISGIPPANPPLISNDDDAYFLTDRKAIFDFVYPRCYRLRELIDAIEAGKVALYSQPS